MCTKNTALGDVSRDKYNTQLRLVLYLSLDTPPRAVFSVQTHDSASSNIISYFAWADQREKVCFIFHKAQGCRMENKAQL